MAVQIDFIGLTVGDKISISELGRFGAAPRVFEIKSIGADKHDYRKKRWLSPVGEPKVQEADKLYERDGWRIEVLER